MSVYAVRAFSGQENTPGVGILAEDDEAMIYLSPDDAFALGASMMELALQVKDDIEAGSQETVDK